jgi:hypothetical protein
METHSLNSSSAVPGTFSKPSADMSTNQVKMTFIFFPRLPTELRLEIWRVTLSLHPRIVEVHWASQCGFTFHSSSPLLTTCKESKSVAAPYFDALNHQEDFKAYFNFENDILYFPYRYPCSTSYGMSLESFLGKLDKDDASRIQHLALSMPVLSTRKSLQHLLALDLSDCSTFFANIQRIARRVRDLNLKSITLVLGDSIMASCYEKSYQLASWETVGIAATFEEAELLDDDPSMPLEDGDTLAFIRSLQAVEADCERALTLPHDRRPYHRLYNAVGHGNHWCTWGTPTLMMKTVRRINGY